MKQEAQAQINTLPDFTSALALAESRTVVDFVIRDYCGLVEVQKGQNIELQRISQPIITFEFAKQIQNNVYAEINRITARTDFERDQLQRIMLIGARAMSEWFGVVGIDNLISPKTWEVAKSLLQNDPETAYKDDPTDQDEPFKFKTFWESKYNISWDYNMPFTYEMLTIIKKDYNLTNESFGQDVILRPIFLAVRTFIEGGLNRSKDHLTLDYEKVIHKETIGQTIDTDTQKKEGAMQSIKNGLSKLFGAPNGGNT